MGSAGLVGTLAGVSSPPYGAWPSPLSAEAVVAASVGVSAPATSEAGVYWLESRPGEAGRSVVVGWSPGGTPRDVTPPGFSVRTRVHEYGGGAYLVVGTTVVFANAFDQRLWRQDPGQDPVAITPEPEAPMALRYADGRATPDGRFVACVREQHRRDGSGALEVANDVVLVPLGAGEEAPAAPGRGSAGLAVSAPSAGLAAVEGHDFVAAPRPSPDGTRLAWISWEHPRMPWDGTELWVAPLSPDGAVGGPQLVAGGPEESVLAPSWSPSGDLWYVSDRSGWWNLYRVGDDRPAEAREAELAVPPWTLGQSRYAWLADGRVVCAWTAAGSDRLSVLDPATGRSRTLFPEAAPGAPMTSVEAVVPLGKRVVVVGASALTNKAVVVLDVDTAEVEVLRGPDDPGVGRAWISVAEPVEVASRGDRQAHLLFYRPANPEVEAPPDGPPPLLVVCHGGPTSAARPSLDLSIQHWTTRGFAVAAVDYGGSSGYGRPYRDLLSGCWGVVDVEDCAAAVRQLAGAGEVDGARVAVRGSSAGGFTALSAMVATDLFAAGTSAYGVADLEVLARDTHKFESHYTDGLVGPWPEAAQLYRERSPLYRADEIDCPVLLLQGSEDEIVPPAQAEVMAAALRSRGVRHAHLVFEGEQHGFRRAETLVAALEAELSFYGQVLGFEPAGDVARLSIVG